ncbi:MAG TPA: ATP-binding protein [Terriglobales bacterium]|nr:ATP-binding protein [Terriglobales bacterium]
MATFRLRTKLLLSLLLISSCLTCATLLIIHQTVKAQVRKQIFEDLQNSIATFRNVLHQRQVMRARSAELISDLPSLKALMTSHDPATIQDASDSIWHVAGSDLFVLADREGRVIAVHTATPGFTRPMAEEQLRLHSARDDISSWWHGGGRLYEVFPQPIYFGSAAENRVLGVLAVGYEVDERLAREVSRIASSEVSIGYADSAVVSTLHPSQDSELAAVHAATSIKVAPTEITLGGERFIASTLPLDSGANPAVRLTVLKSYDQAASFLGRLNRLVLGLGIATVILGSVLIYFIGLNFTRPLENLAAGVRALEAGDFSFPLESRSNDEVGVVSNAFGTMRRSLRQTQQKLLESERLATIGLMASSISHDLRHPLTAILANAEFLSESRLGGVAREDLYGEIRSAVNRMIDLIDSLLEFSRGRESLQLSRGRVDETMGHAVQAVRAHPEFASVKISVSGQCSESWFDQRRLERAFYNLLLNACEAAPRNGKVELSVAETDGIARILISDNGPGIPEPIRERLFQPFVSFGKENGTGLGLTIAQKILEDHGGKLKVAGTSSAGTTFELTLRLHHQTMATSVVHATVVSNSPLVRRNE